MKIKNSIFRAEKQTIDLSYVVWHAFEDANSHSNCYSLERFASAFRPLNLELITRQVRQRVVTGACFTKQ